MASETGKDETSRISDPADAPPAYTDAAAVTGTGGPSHQNAPPSHVVTTGGTDAPPSYDSLYGQVRRARDESTGVGGFLKAFVAIILGTIGCTIMLGIMLAIPIAMIIIGAMNLQNCPAERYIPIYLIVMGAASLIKTISSMGQQIKNKKENNQDQNVRTNPFDGLLGCFIFAWFIAGNVWVFRTKGKFTEAAGYQNYCDGTTFWFAYWSIVVSYIFMGLMCCCMCCAGIAAGVKGAHKDPSTDAA